MTNKLLMWGVISLIVSVFIFPIVYIIFSLWWLLSGDMVTRLTYFSTSFITTLSILLVFIGFSFKKTNRYLDENAHIERAKNLYKKFIQD